MRCRDGHCGLLGGAVRRGCGSGRGRAGQGTGSGAGAVRPSRPAGKGSDRAVAGPARWPAGRRPTRLGCPGRGRRDGAGWAVGIRGVKVFAYGTPRDASPSTRAGGWLSGPWPGSPPTGDWRATTNATPRFPKASSAGPPSPAQPAASPAAIRPDDSPAAPSAGTDRPHLKHALRNQLSGLRGAIERFAPPPSRR